MANLNETPSWAPVTQLELTDRVIGGPGGTANKQAQELVARTAFLKGKVDDLADAGAGKGAEMVAWVHRYAAAATVRTLLEKARDHINAADAGIVPDGVDHTLKMQALVDEISASGGGVIKINAASTEYVMSWVMKPGVFVVGDGQAFGLNFTGTRYNTKIKQPAAGGTVIGWQPAADDEDPINTQIETNCNTGVSHLTLIGRNDAGIPGKGIHVQAASSPFVHDLFITGFADEGFYNSVNSRALHASQINVVDCLLNRTRASSVYAFHLDGGDHLIHDIEAGPSLRTRSSENKYIRGIGIIGDNVRWDNIIGEFSDVAITIAGSYHHGGRSRGEFSYCENFEISCGGSSLGFLDSNAASMHETGLYDGIVLTVASGNNSIVGWDHKNTWAGLPVWPGQIAPGTAARYGLRDDQTGDTNKNNIGPGLTLGNTNGVMLLASSGSAFTQQSADAIILEVNSTTPAINPCRNFYRFSNSGATLVTGFPGFVSGMSINLVSDNENTTLQHNGITIILPGDKNLLLLPRRVYSLMNRGGVFLLESGELVPGFSFVGDSDKVLTIGSPRTIMFTSPITANRTVTLPATGVHVGEKWDIVRLSSSTGAFVVNFGTGGVFAAGTWGEVTHVGSGVWYLTKKGTL